VTIELLTGALVIITAIYAWITYRIMRANERTVQVVRDQNEAALRPYVDIGVVTPPNSHMFMLRIANTGRTGARNVRLELDRDFFQYGKKDGTNLRKTTAFTQPIEQLPPGSEIRFGLAFGPQLVGDKIDETATPPVFSISATYSYGTNTVTEKTTLDVRPYRDAMRLSDPIATELSGMREKELARIASELAKLNSRTEA
jgi:hypothetical protein